jgi:SAM-dependent MidA family methyltransferase
VTSAPTWRQAWEHALYGASGSGAASGFYRRPEGPAGHFRTAAHTPAAGVLAGALVELARRNGCRRLVDVGAGRGELLRAVAALRPPLDLLGVDVVPRPPGLPAGVAWAEQVPDGLEDTLLTAWELLDVVPCTVLQVDDDGVARTVHVDPATGAESLGAPAEAADLTWCERWWPLQGAAPGTRAEVGAARDAAWARLVGRVRSGVLVAVDYGHTAAGRPTAGTLTGFRRGRQVPPVPDSSCDVTAHVAWEPVRAAGERAAGTAAGLRTQRDALLGLGVSGRRPALELARTDPAGYVAALAACSHAAELLDPAGLGSFGWLEQPVPGPRGTGQGLSGAAASGGAAGGGASAEVASGVASGGVASGGR